MGKKLTLDEVIVKIVKVSGIFPFDFSKSVYIKNNTKMILDCNFCKKELNMLPINLIDGATCKYCYHKSISKNNKYSLNEVIALIIEKVGIFQFDFSESRYIHNRTKINIKCNIHNQIFSAIYPELFKKNGCSGCIAEKRVLEQEKLLNQTILKAIKFNGIFNFDFTKSIYIESNSNMPLHCNICNKDIYMTPANLQKGHSCKSCAVIKNGQNFRHTRNEAIELIIKANGIFPFNFDNFEYIRNDHKSIIGCNFCGNDFIIQPMRLFMGTGGCQNCARKQRDKRCSLTNEEFIQQSKEKYGNKFDYSLTNYAGMRLNIILKCNICKTIFETKAKNHLGKDSDGCCKVCQTKKSKVIQTKTTEQFIIEAKLIHGIKYSYELVNYTGSFKKIIIKCNTCCNEFKTTPSIHLGGSNCPLCNNKIFVSISETKWLDELNIPIEYRQKTLILNNKQFRTDAFDPVFQTVYEFYGDFWHGNPNVFDSNKLNTKNGFTFGELYNKTIERENILKENGFKIIKIWEQNWKAIKRFEKNQLKMTQKVSI